MRIVKKILSLVLIFLGSILILVELLTFFITKRPESTEAAYLVGYYFAFGAVIFLGVVFIVIGVRTLRKLRRQKREKDLLDSLPGN